MLRRLGQEWIPVEKTWRLNESTTEPLQGLDKERNSRTLRRSAGAGLAPQLRHGSGAARSRRSAASAFRPALRRRAPLLLPATESLRDTAARTIPYWSSIVFPELMHHDALLVVAHGNSLRSIVKEVKGLSDSEIVGINIPTAAPYVLEFDDRLRLVRD